MWFVTKPLKLTVCVLDDASSNSAEVYSFHCKYAWKGRKGGRDCFILKIPTWYYPILGNLAANQDQDDDAGLDILENEDGDEEDEVETVLDL